MWLVIGLAVGAGLVALVLLVHNLKIAVKPYDWLIAFVGLGFLLFTLQNFTASFAEHEATAAWNFLWMFGTPGIVLLAIAFFLPWNRRRLKPNSSSSKLARSVSQNAADV